MEERGDSTLVEGGAYNIKDEEGMSCIKKITLGWAFFLLIGPVSSQASHLDVPEEGGGSGRCQGRNVNISKEASDDCGLGEEKGRSGVGPQASDKPPRRVSFAYQAEVVQITENGFHPTFVLLSDLTHRRIIKRYIQRSLRKEGRSLDSLGNEGRIYFLCNLIKKKKWHEKSANWQERASEYMAELLDVEVETVRLCFVTLQKGEVVPRPEAEVIKRIEVSPQEKIEHHITLFEERRNQKIEDLDDQEKTALICTLIKVGKFSQKSIAWQENALAYITKRFQLDLRTVRQCFDRVKHAFPTL